MPFDGVQERSKVFIVEMVQLRLFCLGERAFMSRIADYFLFFNYYYRSVKHVILSLPKDFAENHAFFTDLRESQTINSLAEIFKRKVIPLLQEYFYEDYEKIRLVLGDSGKEQKEHQFIIEETRESDFFNGKTDFDLPDVRYRIQDDAFMKIESYKQIGKDL